MKKISFTSLVYLRRYWGYYFIIALAFSVMTTGFSKLLHDSIQQYKVMNFFSHFGYDLIVPKGNSLEALLFVQDIQTNKLDNFIPSNLYNTLKENPEIRLVPILKESQEANTVTIATDLNEYDFNQKLAFLKKDSLNLKMIPLGSNQTADSLWGTNIVNLILVQGPYNVREQLKSLVQKKTVAEYVSIDEKVEQIFKLLGWTEKNMVLSWFVFAAIFISIIFSIFLSVRPIWLEVSRVLKRYQQSTLQILLPLLIPLVFLYGAFVVLISQFI